jgi:uncharacterized membrane protein (UPF0136 family)
MNALAIARGYLFVFGMLTIAGGVLGFVKAKSRPSLIAGTLSGLSLMVAGYLVGTRGTLGLALGLIVSLSLAGRFIGAYKKTGKLMPAGLMSVLAVAGVVFTVVALLVRAA